MESIWSLILIQIYGIQMNTVLDYVKPCMDAIKYKNWFLCKWAVAYFNKCEFKHTKWVQVCRDFYMLIWQELLVISAECPSVTVWADVFIVLWVGYPAAIHSFPDTPTCNAALRILRRHIHSLRRTWLHSANAWLTLRSVIYKRCLLICVALVWKKYSKNLQEAQAWPF